MLSPFGNAHGAHLAGPCEHILKQMPVDGAIMA